MVALFRILSNQALLLACVLAATLTTPIQAQSNADSLKLLLSQSAPDTQRVFLLNELAKRMLYQDADTSLNYAEQALKLSNSLNYDWGVASALSAIGTAYLKKRDPQAREYLMRASRLLDQMGKFGSVGRCQARIAILFAQEQQSDSALFHFREAMKAAEKAKDSAAISGFYANIGAVYYQMGAYEEAAENMFKAAELKGRLNDKTGQAGLYNNIASLFFILEDFDRGLWYMHKAIKLNRSLGNEYRLVKNYNNLLDVHFQLEQIDSALYYAQLALEIAERQDNPSNLYGIYESLGNRYADLDPEMALEYNLKAYEVYLKLEDTQDYNILTLNIASGLIEMGREEEARPFLKDAIAQLETNQTAGLQAEAYKAVARISARLGDHKTAYEYQLKAYVLEDSLLSVERVKAVAEVEARFQQAEQEKAILELESEKELAELRSQQQLAWLWAAVAGLFLFLLGATFIFRAYKQKNRTNRLLELKNTENEVLLKEIHHRVKNNLQVISSLLNLQSASVSDESALQALKEGRGRVKSIALIHQKLYQTEDLSNVDFEEYIEQLTAFLISAYKSDGKRIHVSTKARGIRLDIDTSVPLGLIINELVTNALKHAFEDSDKGEVKVELHATADGYELTVCDNGVGLPNGFDMLACQSLGLKLVNILSRQLKGSVEWESDHGAKFTVFFQETAHQKNSV